MGLPFAILVLERDPLRWSDLPAMLADWAQDAGGFALFGLLIYIVTTLFRRPSTPDAPGASRVMMWALVLGFLSALCFGAGRGIQLVDWLNRPAEEKSAEARRTDQMPKPEAVPETALGRVANHLITAGGVLAIVGFGIPFLRDLLRLRGSRIVALAKLSFKEAMRRRIFWVFLAFLLIFLFPPKWFFPIKAEDEVRTYVAVIYWAMTPLLLLVASLMAAFAIPTDIKNQTIHTVVTKPVERFELVLGRSLGYIVVVSLALLILAGVSLVLLWASNVSEEARQESFKARIPVYGDLEFRNLKMADFKGESVGREWEYRKYIAGASPHRAVWTFDDTAELASLAQRPYVPCEFSFDIFRTTKGDENKGVAVSFIFSTWEWGDPLKPDAQKVQAYQEKRRGLKPNAQPGDPDWAQYDKLAEEFGFFEFLSKEVYDYQTFDVAIPSGLFKAALRNPPAGGAGGVPRMQVVVRCESPTQFLGVAKRDLYLLAGDGSFALNFLKGVLGLWLRLVLVIVVAVCLSTYLSGVIAWLGVIFLVVAGLFQDYIQKLAEGTSIGGGPVESLLRLSKNSNLTVPLDDSPGKTVAEFSDTIFRWILRRVVNVLPDIDRFNWSYYVAEGFNIPGVELFIGILVLFGYLLPWLVLAYYLMKSREIAN